MKLVVGADTPGVCGEVGWKEGRGNEGLVINYGQGGYKTRRRGGGQVKLYP